MWRLSRAYIVHNFYKCLKFIFNWLVSYQILICASLCNRVYSIFVDLSSFYLSTVKFYLYSNSKPILHNVYIISLYSSYQQKRVYNFCIKVCHLVEDLRSITPLCQVRSSFYGLVWSLRYCTSCGTRPCSDFINSSVVL